MKLLVYLGFCVLNVCDKVFSQDTTTCRTSEFEGTCKLVHDCPTVLKNIKNRVFNHTVCGYQDLVQIVCCPPQQTTDIVVSKRISNFNFSEGFDCIVDGSNTKGVVKIKDDCPELETEHTSSNKLCTDEICNDLVCCPITNLLRHKQICNNVDEPKQEIALRLHSNQKCTVRDLNITGIYQHKCDYSDRNKHLKPILTDICNHDVCINWYCCPVNQDDPFDLIYCKRDPEIFTHIEFRGPKCVDFRTGRSGTCRLPMNCPHQHVEQLDRCGRNCCEDYYCCPDIDAATEPLVTQKCLEYTMHRSKKEVEVSMSPANRNTDAQTSCLRVASISGGYRVSPGEYPHMAALGYQIADGTIEFSCGGSLISDRYVLTAGHCLKSKEAGDVKLVRMGVIHLRTYKSDSFDCPEDFYVSEIIPHPEYTKRSVYNDIGLLRLDRDVRFNFHIRPICLPTSSDLPDIFLSMGWGALGASAAQSLSLIQVKQDLFTFEECTDVYQYYVTSRFKQGILNDTQICAGSKTGIQSTCGGDSGGPLLYYNPQIPLKKVHTVYGIVSFGTACGFANSPGIYTKVFPYVEWIQNVVWP